MTYFVVCEIDAFLIFHLLVKSILYLALLHHLKLFMDLFWVHVSILLIL